MEDGLELLTSVALGNEYYQHLDSDDYNPEIFDSNTKSFEDFKVCIYSINKTLTIFLFIILMLLLTFFLMFRFRIYIPLGFVYLENIHP